MFEGTVTFHNTEEKLSAERKSLCFSVIRKTGSSFVRLYSKSDDISVFSGRESAGRLTLIDNR